MNLQHTESADKDDFIYTGSSGDGGRYFRSFLVPANPPERTDKWLYELRRAQLNKEWEWGRPWPENIPYLSINSDQSFPCKYGEPRIRWEDPEQMRALNIWVKWYENICAAAQAGGREASSFIADRFTGRDRFILETAARLKSCRRFVQRRSGIRELCFLRGMGQLKELDLRCNDVEDISEVSHLTGLRELNLDYNLISDISPISRMTQLATLYLSGNRIEDLSPLKEITTLKTLCLDGNPLNPGALACLRKCKRMNMLSLTDTGLKDISSLNYCRASILSIQGNPDITGLEVIASMKNLSCLHLDKSVADRYDIPAIAPRFTEYGSLGGMALYVWPEKFYGF